MTINHVDRLKAKIARGERCVGTSITFTDPAISELVGDAGYDTLSGGDGVGGNTEHSAPAPSSQANGPTSHYPASMS